MSAPALPEPAALAVTGVRLLPLDEGLYVIRLGELPGPGGEVAGLLLPAAQVSTPPGEDDGTVEVIAAFPGQGAWLARDGGTVILRSPPGGGCAIVTAYGIPGAAAVELSLDLQRLDEPVTGLGPPPDMRVAAPPVAAAGGRELPTEILLHIERTGDRLFPGAGWVGALGRRMRVEAFSIRPLEGLAPTEIEMKGLLPNGGETAWVSGGALCGTRGRGLALVGFALRVAPHRADRYDVLYQGSFFAGGISAARRNGDPCRSAVADDPLEAINVRLVERTG